jgi:hypothetical protein
MRLYTVHLRRPALDPARDLALVKEGFSWPAAVFGLLWALWHRLWWVAAGLVAVEAALGLLMNAAAFGEGAQAIVSLGLAVLFGALGNDLRRWTLRRAGFDMVGVVGGRRADAAERRFLENSPGMLREFAA